MCSRVTRFSRVERKYGSMYFFAREVAMPSCFSLHRRHILLQTPLVGLNDRHIGSRHLILVPELSELAFRLSEVRPEREPNVSAGESIAELVRIRPLPLDHVLRQLRHVQPSFLA